MDERVIHGNKKRLSINSKDILVDLYWKKKLSYSKIATLSVKTWGQNLGRRVFT